MSHLPHNWRERLPPPFQYYPARVDEIGTAGGSGIARGRCPLHADKGASLGVNLNTGHWTCPRCGSGTMTVFHQRLTGMTWTDAVSDLIGGTK